MSDRVKTLPKLISIVACLLLFAPFAASAQQVEKIYRIGILGGVPVSAANIEAFRQRLRDRGYVEGRNLVIEYRYSEGRRKGLPALIADLVRLKVEVIVTTGTSLTVSARKVTTAIPIVMATSTDPVGQGLVASLARPGGNVTGLTSNFGELSGKVLQLITEIIPTVSRVAVMLTGGSADKPFLEAAQAPARALGIQLLPLTVRGPADYEDAIRVATEERANALFSRFGTAVAFTHRKQFMELAAKSGQPMFSGRRRDTEAGGLLSYGWDRSESFRRVADYVGKILKGAKPADLPVELPMNYKLVVNLRSAKVLGITVPRSLLLRADEVIE